MKWTTNRVAGKSHPGRPVNRRGKRQHRLRPLCEAMERRLLLTTLPAGFTETLVTTNANLNRPTAMEFTPTGQLWALEQGGAVKVVNPATGATSTAGTLTVDSNGERGLLGLAFPSSYDGAGPNTDFVYLYYTATTPNAHNRIRRFTVTGAGTSTPTIGSEVQILNIEPEPQGDGSTNHNGGAIHFGPDGKLYVAIGDHNTDGSSFQGANHVSQRLDYHLGKILRINPDGTNPSDNPFFVGNSPIRDSIYALGLRNPYTFAFQPGTGRFFINDVGESTWEEINDGIAGSNYGWASEGTPGGFAEGFESSAPSYVTIGTYRNPVMAYDHSNSAPTPAGIAITGGAFYPGNSQFGSAYAGKYFFADFGGNFIRVFNPATPGSIGTPDNSTDFASGLTTGAPVDLKVDAAGSLFYLAGANTAAGKIYKISFNAPAITTQPANQTANQGASATFAVTATGGAPLSYQWQRADSATPNTFSNITGATSSSFTLNNVQSADNGDKFRAIVTNSAGQATSNAATLTVNIAGQAPVITTQPTSRTINVGQSTTFSVVASGTATLTYQWQRADSATPTAFANITGATSSSFTLSNAQFADNADRFRVIVTNSLGSATSNAAVLTVNRLPTATITAPATYTFGQTINFSATATDPEDGTLAAARYTWVVDFGHESHFHPHVAPFSGVTSSSFVANFVEPDPVQFYRITLTVTDSNGATFTTFRDVQPVKVQLTLASNPAGVAMTVDGQPVSGVVDSVVGSTRAIQAPPFPTIGSAPYHFLAWSDGGAATHSIVTPTTNTTYTAAYDPAGLKAEFFDFNTALSTLPDLSTLTPGVVRTDAQVNYAGTTSAWSGLGSGYADTFASRHTGFVNIATAGTYTFYINSDDGSKLWIDGQLLVDNNGLHSLRERSASRTLSAGFHSLRLEFFENAGTAGLQLSWAGPGISKQIIPAIALYPTRPPFQQAEDANHLVSLEAENFDANVSQGGKSWTAFAASGFSGSGALQATPNTGVANNTGYVTNSPRLDYRVNFIQAGTYFVWVRGIGANGNDDSVHVGLDGQAIASADRISGFGTNYSWTKNTMDGVVATINVTTPGIHTLNLWMREDGTVIDKIVLTTSSSFVPTGTGPAESPRSSAVAGLFSSTPISGSSLQSSTSTLDAILEGDDQTSPT